MTKFDSEKEAIPWRRVALIVALSGLVGVVLLWLPILAKPQQSQPRWEIELDEDFSAPFPGSGWTVVDDSDNDGGEYYWGRETFSQIGAISFTDPITALWSIGAGTDGDGLAVGVDTYVDNVDAWAIYGPLDLSAAYDAELMFDWWLDTAGDMMAAGPSVTRLEATGAPESGDWMGWCVLSDVADYENCQGAYVSGSTSEWLSGTLTLNSYTGASQPMTDTQPIWIAFHFLSDDDGQVGYGGFVDNVVIRVNYGYEMYVPLINRDPTPTPSPTPTPMPSTVDYFDSFTDPGSGWTTHTAKTGLSGCDSARQNLDYKYSLFYEGGRYKVNVPLDCRAGGRNGDTRHIYPVDFPPGVTRPGARTCVGMEGSLERWNSFWSFFGVVFASNDTRGTFYSLEVNNIGDWAIIKRTGYQYPGPNHPYLNETRQPVEKDTAYTGGRRWPAVPAFNGNKLEVEIGLSNLVFYINNVRIYEITDPWIVNDVRSKNNVGIIGGNWEITPTQIGYDYFFVDEGCDTY